MAPIGAKRAEPMWGMANAPTFYTTHHYIYASQSIRLSIPTILFLQHSIPERFAQIMLNWFKRAVVWMTRSQSVDWVWCESMCANRANPVLTDCSLQLKSYSVFSVLSAHQRQCTLKCNLEALYLVIKGVGLKMKFERNLSPSCVHSMTAVVVV